ncbi:DUF3114 domain-containing protein [Streptococcus chenjunshii]|uniref:DUF3114 domain-containing protein n=1 Tax=Streptococcus chenjunshii TaxID=2173853 RepID=UPI001F54392A|nr:DUF3114 domain-containing protein [Streptococcus chenjunshii]
MDGNSVNYAENSDGTYHDKVDADPVSEYDPKVRKEVGKEWNNPSTNSKSKDYFDVKGSENRANKRLGE